MSKKTFLNVTFNDIEDNVLSLALKINKELFDKKVKEAIISTAQTIVNEYVAKNLEEENNDEYSDVDENKYRDISEKITYDYVDCEWKRKVLNAVVEASIEGRLIGINELYRAMGAVDNKKRFSTKIGVFLSKSGVKVKKHPENGTTITEYYI